MSYADIPPGFSLAPDAYSDVPAGYGIKRDEGPLTWADVPSKAASNALPSMGRLASDMAQPFLHPLETAGNMHKLFSGLGAKFGYGDPANEQYADAAGQFYKDRYGSMEGVKKALAEDPAGVLADAATVLTGGAGTAARIPGAAGRVTNAVGAVGRAIDPITNSIRASEFGAKTLVPGLLGTTTGVGMAPIQKAAQAGAAGGAKATDLADNLRGIAPAENVVVEAKGALGNMAAERSAEYTKGMESVKADTTPLDFNDIDKAVVQTNKVKQFRGVDTSPETGPVRKQLAEAVEQWKGLSEKDPAFRTAEGMDALKQRIGSIKDAQAFGTPERKIANDVYSAVRQTIVKQAPQYADVMKGYERASDVLENIEKSLSLGKKSSTDTAMRKLQSVMRNNVNTNYGNRTKLAEALADAGAPNLMEKLAGQSMSSWMPRGLANVTAGGGALAVGNAAWTAGSLAPLAKMIPLAAVSSPRAVGEAALLAGKASNYLPSKAAARKALLAALNAGRLPTE